MTTASEIELRPELIMGPNPFIEALPPFVPFDEIGSRLTHYPLDDKPWRDIRPKYREPLLDLAPMHFAPFTPLLEPASGLQTLLRRSLVLRNPVLPAEQRRTNAVALSHGYADMQRIASLDAAGGIWKGMTGTGRTTLAVRVLELLSPTRVVDFGSSEVCGWSRLRHVPWLYVDHPSNGTRGALLKRIFEALDKVLGSDYWEQYRRTDNIDTLLTAVCKLLSNHRVAVLVVDEKQQSNFADSPWRLDFVLFYLGLMNLGICVLLIGNPLAFDHLEVFSQVMRRFAVGGQHSFAPAATAVTKWWREDFVPRERKFTIVERCSIDPAQRDKIEFDNTGGIPGLYAPLHCETMRRAVRRGGLTAETTLVDLKAALRSPRFLACRRIALSLAAADGDVDRYVDVPELAGRHGSKSSGKSSTEPTKTFELPDGATVEAVKRLLRHYKAETTRGQTKLIKRLEALKGMRPEDIRTLGVTKDLLAELNKLEDAGKDEKKAKVTAKPAPARGKAVPPG